MLLYALRQQPLLRAAAGWGTLGNWVAGVAFIPISLYNGKRGFIRGNIAKYAFYLIYPVHIMILWMLKNQFFR